MVNPPQPGRTVQGQQFTAQKGDRNSLDIVDMVMTLEDEFGIEVPDDAIENLRTVGDVVNFVDSHQANG